MSYCKTGLIALGCAILAASFSVARAAEDEAPPPQGRARAERPDEENPRGDRDRPRRPGPPGEEGRRGPEDRRPFDPPGPGGEGRFGRGPREDGPPRRGPEGRFPGFPMGPGGMGMGMGMGGMERQDPEMFKLLSKDEQLDRESREMAMRLRRAPSEQRAEMKKALQELVGQQFEVRQQRRELELRRLEEEIKRLREIIDRRKEARESLVGKRISELIGEDEGVNF